MASDVQVAETIAEVRQLVAAARGNGCRIGLVPTMGALHEGHASLIRAAKAEADFVVVSIFVNPIQFGPSEDYARYPRTLPEDLEICRLNGGQSAFVPSVTEMYPEPCWTFTDVEKLSYTLCGPRRPGHFRGVCTVVQKLFNIVQPDLAWFGAKDGQQARVIRRMVSDLNIPVEIRIGPTVREADGLAMSSRNQYLNKAERQSAAGIYQALSEVRRLALERPKTTPVEVEPLRRRLEELLKEIPGARLEYAEFVDERTLQPLDQLDGPALVAVALTLGQTRLIDNVTIP